MKLNKKGWGLTTEIIFILIFIVCLIIAFVGFAQLGLFTTKNPNDNTTNNSNEFSYESLELKLKNSAKDYIKDVYNNELGLDTLILKASLLRKEGYLNNYVDEDDKYCTGYAEVYLDSDNKIVYNPYVKCGDNYESKGYLERKDDYEQ